MSWYSSGVSRSQLIIAGSLGVMQTVWIINYCLGLGHETMVCAVCLTMFLWYPFESQHIQHTLLWKIQRCKLESSCEYIQRILVAPAPMIWWTYGLCCVRHMGCRQWATSLNNVLPVLHSVLWIDLIWKLSIPRSSVGVLGLFQTKAGIFFYRCLSSTRHENLTRHMIISHHNTVVGSLGLSELI